jgi:auxin efflux carrier family protein
VPYVLQIVYNIFLPCLLLTSVAKTAASQPLGTLVALPISAWLQIGIGFLVARLTMAALKIDPDTEAGREVKVRPLHNNDAVNRISHTPIIQRRHHAAALHHSDHRTCHYEQVCSGFGNSGVLPLLFVTALFRGHPDPTVMPKAIAYVSFFLMGWSPAFWTVGYSTLTSHLNKDTTAGSSNAASSTTAVISASSSSVYLSTLSQPPGASRSGSALAVVSKRAKLLSVLRAAKRKLQSPTAARILSPPIIACVLGLAVGTLAPFRWLLMDAQAPLAPFWNSLTVLANAYTPSGVLVLAGSLANGPPQQKIDRDTLKKVSILKWYHVSCARV